MDPLLYLTGCALEGLLAHPHMANAHPMTGDAKAIGARARELARATLEGLDADLLARMEQATAPAPPPARRR